MTKFDKMKKTQEDLSHERARTLLLDVSRKTAPDLLDELGTSWSGLSEEQVEAQREKYGENVITHGKKKSLFERSWSAFVNPFTIVLFILGLFSFFTDIVMAVPGDKEPLTVVIISTMVLISGILRFIQETRSGNAAEKLTAMIKTTTNVTRIETGHSEILLEDVVVGDIVNMAAGDIIPADVRVLRCKDLFISQSALTGESEPLEKTHEPYEKEFTGITDLPNLIFMGSNVISGTAVGVVVSTGNDTLFGSTARTITKNSVQTSFEKGVNTVSWVLIRFMLVMVPLVLFINGFTKGDWMHAFLFAISIAVGLTPEMLPMIVTTCLAKGAVSMSKKKTIIKKLDSIQNLGAVDILCTDKTGTLTQDKIVLEYHMDVTGDEDLRVLQHAFLNSYFQTGLKNLIDIAIIERTDQENKKIGRADPRTVYQKVDEVPFDFARRRMSVVVADGNGKTQMITKGAVEEILSVCTYVDYKGDVKQITSELKEKIMRVVNDFNEDGMRVIAVAQKTNPSPVGAFSVADEVDMVLLGYLALLDPPKDSAAAAIKALAEYGVRTKILTGDNDKVTACICRQVGLVVDKILLGSDVESMEERELSLAVEEYDLFAKLSPDQKARIVAAIRSNGHTVGYMGDGINDAAAMKASDAGISVDTAVDIAKESADIILLEKDLMVLEMGIIEGRKTYANMIKYIKMTASSNFGNVFSVLIASVFLPFMPMESMHLILLNLIYDISCTAIPWDNVDEEFIRKPRAWDASSVGRFMIWIGPTSSIFDVTTFLLMFFVICPSLTGGQLYHQITDPAMRLSYIAIFQSGWFIESMWSQTLVIHMIRTPKIPFVQSIASFPVMMLSMAGILVLTLIPFTGFGTKLDLAPVPPVFFAWLVLTIFLYMTLATIAKKLYIRNYGELL